MYDNRINRAMNKRAKFLQFMRYVAVSVVTIVLVIMAIMCSGADGFDIELALFFFIIVSTFLFFITLPIIGFWIYSFAQSVKPRAKTDKVLLCFHIADILILAIIIFLANQRPHKCDAFIMAQYYEGENGWWMRDIANRYRRMLPDSTHLCVEFENGSVPQLDILSEQDMKKLKRELEDCGCIGIEIDNYSNSDYSTLRFRRIGMGMYLYRLYDNSLTRRQQDSLNANECLIVYNDSTVFEFRSGVLGVQFFVGKQEFLEKRSKKSATIDTIAVINRISNFEQDYHIDPIIDSISHNLLQICPVSDIVGVPDSVAYVRYLYADGSTRCEGWCAFFNDPEDDFSNPFGVWKYYDEQGNCYRKFWKYKENDKVIYETD